MNTKIFQLNNGAMAISKRTGDHYAIWFQPTRSFVLFAKPAYRVFCMVAKNTPPAEIVKNCSYNFNHPLLKSSKGVFELIEQINNYLTPAIFPGRSAAATPAHQSAAFEIFSQKRYLIWNKSFTVCYGNSYLEQCFDPLFSHLSPGPYKSDYLFEMFEYSGQLVFRNNNKVVKSFVIAEVNQFMGAVFQQIYSLIYDINPRDWMMNLHASGISDGKSAILFPAEAGSGKTTLAALLHANGFSVIADDFIAVDAIQYHTFRFPAALSIKEGAMESLATYYPQLSTTPITEKAFNNKRVRYMALGNYTTETSFSFPIKAVVFMHYTADKAIQFDKIDQKTALPLLLKEAWVDPTPSIIEQFFYWFDTVEFYRLSYSENTDAIEAITNIFKK